jgi:hypothetical protein
MSGLVPWLIGAGMFREEEVVEVVVVSGAKLK